MTQETNDAMTQELIERLRAKRTISSHGLGTAFADPLCEEAADALQSQSARIAELEGALAKAQCVHEWEWIKTTIEADGVTNHVTWHCSKCLLARTSEHIASLTKGSTSGGSDAS